MTGARPDVLVTQAEAALRKLDDARLQERCPKACKSCSQKHRKCQFKNGHPTKCDLCAKNNRECEIISTPITHPRRSDEIVTAQQYPSGQGFPSSPTTRTLERPHRPSSDAYTNMSAVASPVDPRSSTASAQGSYAYHYQYNTAPSNAQTPSGSHAYSNSQHQFSPYPAGHVHSSPTAIQGRNEVPYYIPSQANVHSTSPGFAPSPTQWPETHGPQTQLAPSIGQGYGYSGSTHTTSPVRQTSAPSVPQIHPSGGSAYIRTAHGYQVASPVSPGGSYPVAGSSVYQMPSQTPSAVRYSAGTNTQGYDQSLNSASSGPANDGSIYYQPSMRQ